MAQPSFENPTDLRQVSVSDILKLYSNKQASPDKFFSQSTQPNYPPQPNYQHPLNVSLQQHF
jgi:hypothetical protein